MWMNWCGSFAAREAVNAALEHHRAGRLAEAETGYRQALEVDPDNVDALHFLGVIAHQQGRQEQAQELILRALSLNDANAPAHNNLGNVFRARGEDEQAIASYRRAVELAPDYLDACLNLAAAYLKRGDFDDAAECCRRAQSLSPDSPAGYSNLGHVRFEQGRLEEAVTCYEEALRLGSAADTHYNLGQALMALGRREDANEHYRLAFELDPGNSLAKLACALAKLLEGDYESGLALYESRFEEGALKEPVYAKVRERLDEIRDIARWPSVNISCKTLLVWADQGLGDSIMMIRYLPELKRRGAEKLVVSCQRPLLRLVQGIEGVDEVIESDHPLPAGTFDFHCPLTSLPLLFGTRLETIPNDVPYVFVPPALKREWARTVSDAGLLRVGLIWAGRREYSGDQSRSVPLERFSPLLKIRGVDFVSLQKGQEARQIERTSWKIHDWMDHCQDLLDTAALMEQLDLIIGVDTGPIHLAGALGKPVWLLNRLETDWRWMLDREDSPWYPTMKIFRQRKPKDWDEAIGRMASALQELCSAGRDAPRSTQHAQAEDPDAGNFGHDADR